jgi:hypothetical protein
MELFDTGARIAVVENELKNVAREVQELRLDSKEQHKQMMDKITEIDKRLGVIEKWRWMVVGGALVLGYVGSHFFKI